RRPRPRAPRRGGRARAAAAPRPHLPRPRRQVPADGRAAAGSRGSHRDRAPGRRRSLGLTRLGVLGWPVAHSRSPAMHNAALRAALGECRPRSPLILGAGGSARAAAYALPHAGATVMVWNRTAQRARELAADLGVEAVDERAPADVLVNCTSVGLADPSSTFK